MCFECSVHTAPVVRRPSSCYNMSRNLKIASASFIYIFSVITKKTRNRKCGKERRRWITQFLRRREDYGGINHLQFELNSGYFKNFLRMGVEDFEFLINTVGPKIQKRDTNMRKAISVQERLAVTLRFLATGDPFISLQYLFKISKQSISEIVPQVCNAIIETLRDYVKLPTSVDEWLSISNEFNNLWNFPHCIGSMDGKHVILQSPINSGSEFFNYKSTYSIVLFALVDANYNFIFADIGCQGRISDGGIFRQSQLHKKLENWTLNLPEESALPERTKKIPYVIVADIMKPFAGTHAKGSTERIFNYRLSRCRRIVENVFGIASSVFRVLRKPLLLQPEKARLVVMTVVYLHIFLRKSKISQDIYTPPGTFDYEINGEWVPGSWRNVENSNPIASLLPLKNVPRRAASSAKEIRDELAAYFTTSNILPWQNQYC